MAAASGEAPAQGEGAGRPLLAIEGLGKVYPGGTRALDGVTFTVGKPEVIAIIGSSGAGKSTLIRCINRLVEPTSGSVRLGGTDVVKLGTNELRQARRRIGMIFQEFNLVDRLTVMENILSGRLGSVGFLASWMRRYPPQDVANAFAMLERVGLAGLHDSRADALSGGQRQRVGIGRALMQNPDVLLVDEPTASLDPKTARQIMRLIRSLAEERATPALVNIHDVALAQGFADRIIGLQGGKLVFDGPSGELSPEVLTRIYGAEDWSRTIRKADEEEAQA
jgi:phosphonate transport system ATP-binding protein